MGPMRPPHGAATDKSDKFGVSMGKLIKYLKPFWIGILSAVILAIIGAIATIAAPKITQKILDQLIMPSGIDFTVIMYYGITLAVVYIVSQVLAFIQHNIMAIITAKVSRNLRKQISDKINTLPLSYFDKRSYGDVLSCVTNDIDTIGQTLNQSLSNIITSITMVIGVIIMMFVTSYKLTFVALAMIPVSIIIVLLVVKFSQKYFINQQNALGSINGHIEEIYSGHAVVKVYGGKHIALDKFNKINGNLTKNSFLSQFFAGILQPLMMFASNLSLVVVAIVGATIAIKNPIFVTSIITCMTYVRQLNQPIAQLGSIMGTLQQTAAASERVFKFFEAEDEIADTTDQKQLTSVKGKIVFNNVGFGYDPDKEIIHNFNCVVEPGEKIAIVGPTGAGKTTLVNLLMRFYEVNSGCITVDGVRLNDMTREEVRSIFGMVLQDTWLFTGTIRENLIFGNKNATEEDMFNACKACKIDHFIRALPNSYDMLLDENSNISQGQRQLFTIARAMIENAPVLILDEATSSVDTRTEILIQEAMDALTADRTSFVIAHRLSTIKNADKILVMKDGNVVEVGSHDELMANGGFYKDLYNSQFADKEE